MGREGCTDRGRQQPNESALNYCSCSAPSPAPIPICSEIAIMALDYYAWTGDASYLPIAYNAATFLMEHFTNRSADGRVLIWPAQVLETHWCDWDVPSQQFVNCCENDAPTVSAMLALMERLLQLPPSVATPTQLAAWAAFLAIAPQLPLAPAPGGSVIAAASVISNGTHNSEGVSARAAQRPRRPSCTGSLADTPSTPARASPHSSRPLRSPSCMLSIRTACLRAGAKSRRG